MPARGAQQDGGSATGQWWVNFPSSPLEFNLFPNRRFLGLTNRSSKRVVGFTLACVTRDGGGVRVANKTTTVNAELEAAGGPSGQHLYFQSLGAYDRDRACCLNANAKLAVISVSFMDGTAWEVGGDAAARQTGGVCVDSWREGDERVVEQSFRLNLTPGRREHVAAHEQLRGEQLREQGRPPQVVAAWPEIATLRQTATTCTLQLSAFSTAGLAAAHG